MHPAAGLPRSIGDKKVEEILAQDAGDDPAGSHALEQPPNGQEAGFSEHSVLQNLARLGLKPHRVGTPCPRVRAQRSDVCGEGARICGPSISIRLRKPSCFVSMRRARLKPWSAANPSCRCVPICPSVRPTIMYVTGPFLSLPLTTRPLDGFSADVISAIAIRNSWPFWNV